MSLHCSWPVVLAKITYSHLYRSVCSPPGCSCGWKLWQTTYLCSFATSTHISRHGPLINVRTTKKMLQKIKCRPFRPPFQPPQRLKVEFVFHLKLNSTTTVPRGSSHSLSRNQGNHQIWEHTINYILNIPDVGSVAQLCTAFAVLQS